MKKLLINNLPPSATEESLKKLFSQSGTVEEATIPNEVSGEKAHYGIVVFENDKEADEAVQRFHGQEFEGSSITVTPATTLRGDDSGEEGSQEDTETEQSESTRE
jgi:cold-inducible RNA-binding protein